MRSRRRPKSGTLILHRPTGLHYSNHPNEQRNDDLLTCLARGPDDLDGFISFSSEDEERQYWRANKELVMSLMGDEFYGFPKGNRPAAFWKFEGHKCPDSNPRFWEFSKKQFEYLKKRGLLTPDELEDLDE